MFKKVSRYRFAFFTSYIDGDEYNRKLLNSIDTVCKDNNIDLVMFPSRNVHNDEIHNEMILKTFDFFNPNLFDGILLSSSSLINFIGQNIFNNIIDRLLTKPTVSIGIECKKIPSIIVDNTLGITEIVEHLVHKHNYKNFLFVSGKKDHPEAIKRSDAFTKALESNNINFKEDMIIHGDFTRDKINKYLKEKLQTFTNTEAIVCANDTMAREVIDILNKDLIKVPNKIAVTGFDNSISANLEIPRITTSSQPTDEVSKEAISILIKQIKKEKYPILVKKKPKLVINESCGCLIKNDKSDNTIEFDDYYYNLENKFRNITENEQIIFQIKEDLSNLNNQEEITIYKKCIVHIIGTRYKNCFDVKMLKELSELGLQIINILKEYEIRELLKHHIDYKKSSSDIRILLESLLSSDSLESLFLNLDSIFNKINITTYFVVLNNSKKNDELFLFHGVKEGNFIDCRNKESQHLTNNFIPSDLLSTEERISLISIPLFSLNKFFGFILFDSKNLDIGLLENIHMSLSATIMNILSVTKLKETQKLLVESEKLAFLGNMVAGVAHEINTPVGISITASTYLRDLLNEKSTELETGTLKKSDLTNFFTRGKETLELIDKSLKNTVNIIEKFKEVSTNDQYDSITDFKISDAISETIKLLKDTLISQNINISLYCNNKIKLRAYKSAFIRVLTNLIHNSVLHAFNGVPNPKITISIGETKQKVYIVFKDNGVGCPESDIHQIYNPFYTTKRSQGFTGLGLSIVHNLVKIRLNGEIITENCLYKGLKTKIILTKSKL